jgi:hypothetical protein
MAIRFWDLMALSRGQKKLFPHFGEPGTAVFAVEEVEYGGHDRTPRLIITTLSFLSGCKTWSRSQLGGFLQLTTVTEREMSTRRIHCWPDQVGEPILAARGAIGPFDQGSLLHNQKSTRWRRFGRLPGKVDARSDKP